MPPRLGLPESVPSESRALSDRMTKDISYSKKVSGLLHNRGIFNSDDSQRLASLRACCSALGFSGVLFV